MKNGFENPFGFGQQLGPRHLEEWAKNKPLVE